MNTADSKSTPCTAASTLIFACSGAVDVGQIADQAARALSRDGAGKMFCLAGIGGRVPVILETTEAADRILAIDGCPISCVAHCLEEAGFGEFHHLQLADLGLQKGMSPLTDERLGQVCAAANEALAS